MKTKEKLTAFFSRSPLGARLISDRGYRIIGAAICTLLLDQGYACYNGFLGWREDSHWFRVMCTYYAVLGVMRFGILVCHRRVASAPSLHREEIVKRVTGALLLLLSGVLSAVIYVSQAEQTAVAYDMIPMLTIATYTFIKLPLVVLRAIRRRRERSPLFRALQAVGWAEAAVSVLTLQRSMLVSFPGMEAGEIVMMNALTGGGVCLFLFLLGILLIRRERRGKTEGAASGGRGGEETAGDRKMSKNVDEKPLRARSGRAKMKV